LDKSKKKFAILDFDGVVNLAKRFSKRYSTEHNLDIKILLPFFDSKFQLCLIGKADLKKELAKVLKLWRWSGTVEELLDYWFSVEINIDDRMIQKIHTLKSKGVIVIGATNQEKYRTQYLRKKLHLDTLFDKFYSSVDLGIKKPDGKFYESILNDINAEPSEVVNWDDSTKNVDSASNLGIKSYLYKKYSVFEKQCRDNFVSN